MAEIVLVGYYGKGNFGDDILLKVTHSLARQISPQGTIGVRIDPGRENYIPDLLDDDVESIPFGTRTRHKLIIHGGGGTYFDFGINGTWDQWLERAWRFFGARSYAKAERLTRRALGKPRLSAPHRIGLGIGVGTFAPGSPKLRGALPDLLDFDALWVRDPDSLANLKRLGLQLPTVLGSDLAFMTEHWCPAKTISAPTNRTNERDRTERKPALGVILRDWPNGSGAAFAESFTERLAYLEKRFDVTAFSFDQTTNLGTISALSHYPMEIWRPGQISIAQFVQRLQAQDVLLTSRAHGAICGACLGRASVILDIEPKLKAVHEMLPSASRLVSPNSTAEDLELAIESALAIPTETIAADVALNRESTGRALTVVQERIA